MTTRREMINDVQKELFHLQVGWRRLFLSTNEEEGMDQQVEDMLHPPAALGVFLGECITEISEGINQAMNHAVETGQIGNGGRDAFDYATNALANACMLIGNRMFRLGQEVGYKLKYGDLTPCICSTVPDDELEEFLRNAAEGPRAVEGEGWVIREFGKETE